MATFNAIKNLGKSIVTDIADAKNAVVSRVQLASAERRIVNDFKATLREHPLELLKAMEALRQPAEAKPKAPRTQRKPKAKPATA